MIGRLRKYATDIGGYACNLVIEADFSGLRPFAPLPGIEIRQFGSDNWALLGDLVCRRVAPVFTAAARAGRSCLVAWRGSRALGYIWLSPAAELRHENFALPLPPDANYLWQLQVARSQRRQGVCAALVSAGLQWSMEQGFRRSRMITRNDNVAAQRTIASLAPCLVLGKVRRVKVGPWMRSRYLPLAAPRPLHPRVTA
ncbi:MAG TPA: GNAT family N-acetyltransferase [Gemmatimonadales bacterium]|nr:GNAT family N-acetyltransferase [Gemmatimonadales bacterium]